MPETDIRTCPHCGVSISWNTPYCPNCDEELEIDSAEVEASDAESLALDDAQVMTVLATEVQNPPDSEEIAEQSTIVDEMPDFPSKLPERMATLPPIEADDTNNVEATPLEEARVYVDSEDSGNDETAVDVEGEDFATVLGDLPEEEQEEAIRGNVDRTVTMVDEVANAGHLETVEEPIIQAPDKPNLPETKLEIPIPVQTNESEANIEEPLEDIKTRGLPPDLDALSTLPASHSAIAGSSPVAPAARVPEPEPLPPMDTETGSTNREPTHQMQAVVIPSAPFTPPPVANYQAVQQPAYPAQPSPYATQPHQALPYSYQQSYPTAPAYGQPNYQTQPQYMQPAQPAVPNDYWLNQRVDAYQNAGYELIGRNQYEGLLRQSKTLPFFWWIVAGWTIFGAAWYFLILLTTGFNKDKVYIGLEPDGYIFEEGSGSAHIRRKRERSGRRWGVVGIIIFILSTLLFLLLLVAGYFLLDSYSAELNEAFPAVTLFRDYGNDSLNQSDVENARTLAFIMITLYTISLLGIISGYILTIISYIQAAAYRVNITPLPGYD